MMVWKCRCEGMRCRCGGGKGVCIKQKGSPSILQECFILITYYACVYVPLLPRLIEEVRDAASGVTLVNDEVYMSSR